MKQKKLYLLILSSLVFLVLSTIYSVLFNDSRLVVPTDFSTFQLTVKDIPMLLSINCLCLTILYTIFRAYKEAKEKQKLSQLKTRKLNPKLGFLGFLGFLGLYGFYPSDLNESSSYFIYFMFFGFFGFYYEGKLSDTLVDEMFQENRKKAALKAYDICFKITFIMLLISPHVYSKYLGTFLLISLSLIVAVTMFLREYLTYYYERKCEI